MTNGSRYCIHGNDVTYTDCMFCYVEREQERERRSSKTQEQLKLEAFFADRPPPVEPSRPILPTHPKAELGKQKAQLQLIPPEFLLHTARALKEGADKYGPYNWRETGVDTMSYIGAMMRHLASYMAGEDIDPESGKHHLAGVAASVAIVLDCASIGMLRDTRPHTKLAKKKDDK